MNLRNRVGWILLGAALGQLLGMAVWPGLPWAIILLPVSIPVIFAVSFVAWAGFVIGTRTRHPTIASAIAAAVFGVLLYVVGLQFDVLGPALLPPMFFGTLLGAILAPLIADRQPQREPRRPSGYTEPTEP